MNFTLLLFRSIINFLLSHTSSKNFKFDFKLDPAFLCCHPEKSTFRQFSHPYKITHHINGFIASIISFINRKKPGSILLFPGVNILVFIEFIHAWRAFFIFSSVSIQSRYNSIYIHLCYYQPEEINSWMNCTLINSSI